MDHQFFQNTIHPHRHKLYRFAFTLTQQRDLAEDVVQEVFEKVWAQGQEGLSMIHNWEAWCMTLTRNLCLDKLKSPKYRNFDPIETTTDRPTMAPSPLQTTESRDTLAFVRQIMEALPTPQRMVMHLRDVEEMSYEEIAQALDMTLDQVKVNLHRGRKSMREKLTQKGFNP